MRPPHLTPPPQRTVYQATMPPVRVPRPTRRKSGGLLKWLVIAPLALMILTATGVCAALTLGTALIYGSGVLPKVSVAGIDLGGLSQAAAADKLRTAWTTLVLRDGDRTWDVAPAELGITLDADATARQAYAQGRGEGNALQAIFEQVDVPPVVSIDIVTAAVTLNDLAPHFEIPAVNAGVQLVNGQVQATPPQEGRVLDVVQLITRLDTNVAGEVADGVIDLPMHVVAPTVTDATPLLTLASDLLTRPLQIDAYDPINDQHSNWSLLPDQWSAWLTTTPDATSPVGVSLALDDTALSNYLASKESTLQDPQYLHQDEAAQAIDNALAQRTMQALVRVYHRDSTHVVQPGETLITIAWDYGVPYPWIQAANPGLGDTLSIGQSITIPSPDNFLEFPVVPNKRIVVSMSEQRVFVYENGQLKWDWPASTGITSSPTWPGTYQIISHVPNAYAAQWNLWMPNFLGVYRPIPGQDFTNGFHGFPTRGGSQLLWTNDLGHRVTYGCILISSTNAGLLFDWAENGVVVDILP